MYEWVTKGLLMQERRSRKEEKNCVRAEAHIRNESGAAIKSKQNSTVPGAGTTKYLGL